MKNDGASVFEKIIFIKRIPLAIESLTADKEGQHFAFLSFIPLYCSLNLSRFFACERYACRNMMQSNDETLTSDYGLFFSKCKYDNAFVW